MLRIIPQNTKYLALQGLPLCCHGDDTESNFQQLLKLRVEDVTTLANFERRRTGSLYPLLRTRVKPWRWRLHTSSIMSDALDNCQKISDLLKYSPKRDALFRKIKAEIAPESIGFRILCPTRWTGRGNCLQSVYENYEVLRTL